MDDWDIYGWAQDDLEYWAMAGDFREFDCDSGCTTCWPED